jgi:peptide/nickel transport system ATP-binding protein
MTLVALASPVLQVRDLTVALHDGTPIVSGIGFAVNAGEILGLVGESGCGKTTIATALLGATRPGAVIADGAVLIEGTDLLDASPEELRAARGPVVAHVAQDPAMALNPMTRIGKVLDEMLRVHAPQLGSATRLARIASAAADVGLPSDAAFLRRFPHQLSGGQQQRVLLALAVLLQPKLIVLDEPTTALDVTTQARVLGTLRELCRKRGIAAVYVSHDLAVVRELVDRVLVLYAGRIVEAGPREAVFSSPQHPYSAGLLDAVPDLGGRRILRPIPGHAPELRKRPAGCAFAPRCPRASAVCVEEVPIARGVGEGRIVACHHAGAAERLAPPPRTVETVQRALHPLASFSGVNAWYGDTQILFDVDLSLRKGLCTALVGESGSGKTTFARAAVGLIDAVEGAFRYAGEDVTLGEGERSRELRRRIQYIFQNPFRALNPRQSVGEILRTAARHFFAIDREEADRRVAGVLERVALPPEVVSRRPRELSGGERQRVAIARALICEPELLICDEITSALDVSVQASILTLLQQLQAGGLTILFVTHDLAVVRAIADEVAVLRSGRVVEQGPVDAVLDSPQADYTRVLLADSPRLEALAR